MAKTNKKKVGKPKLKEETKGQYPAGVASLMSDGLFTGFNMAVTGTYKTYRNMRKNPTVALARMMATAPIRTAKYGLVAVDGTPQERIDFIEDQMKSHWPELIHNLMYAIDYGWAPFEKIWMVNSKGKYVYRKIKPLLVDKTIPIVDKITGTFKGLKQNQVRLSAEKSFVYTYDKEAGNIFGRSRHENIRETAWNHWQQISERRGQWGKKVAGVTPIVEYPIGKSENEAGELKSNFDLAKAVLAKLGQGDGVAMPNTMAKFAGDLARSGIDLGKLKAWHIMFLETKGLHGREFTNSLKHLESLIMRGWLVPERAGTEGQSGTKAEAEVHGGVALTIADLVFADILKNVNWYLVNPLLVYNYGREAENTIWLERGELDPLMRAFYRELVKAVLTHPQNYDLLESWIDIDTLVTKVGLPKTKTKIDVPRHRVTDRPVPNNSARETLARKIYRKVISRWS